MNRASAINHVEREVFGLIHGLDQKSDHPPGVVGLIRSDLFVFFLIGVVGLT